MEISKVTQIQKKVAYVLMGVVILLGILSAFSGNTSKTTATTSGTTSANTQQF